MHLLSRVGLFQASPQVIKEKTQFYRLFCHETERVFCDRLTNEKDKNTYKEMFIEVTKKYFSSVSFMKYTHAY